MTTTVLFDKNQRLMDRNELVCVLRQAGGTKLEKRYIVCPFHDDHAPSAEIKQASASGKWYFYCHTCGISGEDVWSLQARVEGRDVGDVLREAIKAHQRHQDSEDPPWVGLGRDNVSAAQQADEGPMFETVEALITFYRLKNPRMVLEEVNRYTDPETQQPDLITVRYLPEPGAKKVIAQATPRQGGWVLKGIPGNRQAPLYNREGLAGATRVVVVEGEKCARAIIQLGLKDTTAVTSPGGSKNALKCDWSPLAGKVVYIWGDNDNPGQEYANDVIKCLEDLDPPCTILAIPIEELKLPDHGDVVDYFVDFDNNNQRQLALEQALITAGRVGAASSLFRLFDKIESGEYSNLEFQIKPHLTNATQAFLPGTVTLISGAPGSGKSFFVLEEAWRQFEKGINVRILMLEENHEFHMRRCLVQMSGESQLLDTNYCQANSKWMHACAEPYKPRLFKFGRILDAVGSEERTIFAVADWIEEQASAGARLIIVDPITAASTGDMSWKDDRKFMMRAKKAAETYGASVLLVTHPRVGKAGVPGLDGLAGGAAYVRFSQTVIWIKTHEEEQTSTVRNNVMDEREAKYRRSVHVYKARNGRDNDSSTNRHIAVELNPNNLCFRELGMIKT